jgi:anaerobic selenocysteine-containing dehydrogenase
MRTNNSWIHNAPMAVKGRERCTLKMHPRDAEARGLVTGQQVSIHSRVSRLTASLEVSDELMEGVVSLPHGWGHRGEGLALRVASQHPGVNVNDLTDPEMIEPVTGNAILNGVPVEVRA